MSRVVSFSLWLLRSRVMRAFLGLALGLWAFDGLIWGITQRSFFASVGLEAWFWRLYLPPLELFTVFFSLCGFAMLLALRSLMPLEREAAPPLRGILARFEPLRQRITKISRVLALVLAALLARDFARHGLEWSLLQNGGRVGFAYLGLDASLWTRWLPLWMPFLLGLWKFSLALGLLTAITGMLRALPVIAQRNSAPPALSRVLWRTGAALLALRALLYLSQCLDLPRGAPLSSGDVWVLAPLYLLGALWCAWLGLAWMRRAFKPPTLRRGQTSRAAGMALAALFSPAILGFLSYPIRAVWPESAALEAERERATRAAWHLPETPIAAAFRNSDVTRSASGSTLDLDQASVQVAPANAARFASEAATIERVWPVWDEAAVLAMRAGAGFSGGRVIEWKSATLAFQNARWRALLVGEDAGGSAWNASREVGGANDSNALALERLDLDGLDESSSNPTANPTTARLSAPTAAGATRNAPGVTEAFYGLEGRSLFGRRGGIDLGSPALKWAWAWRERDLFLPVDAARAPHLLTLRGARERALALAPWLDAEGAPRLEIEGQNPVWTLDLCALSPHFPGAMRGASAEFAGANSASSPFQMRLDARSGATSFAAAPEDGEDGGDKGGAPLSGWRAAFPGIATQTSGARQAGGELGRAQLEILSALRGQSSNIYGPTRSADPRSADPRSADPRSATNWRVLSVAKTDFEVLESASPRPILQPVTGDVGARLLAIDEAIAKIRTAKNSASNSSQSAGETAGVPAPASQTVGNQDNATQAAAGEVGVQAFEAENIRAGEPFVWRAGRAPGGFWIGRAFFAIPRGVELGATPLRGASHPPLLWRVALTGLAPNSRVGIGVSAREALRDLRGAVPPTAKSAAPRGVAAAPLNLKAPLKVAASVPRVTAPLSKVAPLEEQLLQTHRALEAAIKRSDWSLFGTLNKRQTALLERLVARRRALSHPAPRSIAPRTPRR